MEKIVCQTLPKKIIVTAMVPNDLWPVLGNSTQLHQVLLNLCVNARDAMPDGGELTLAADNVELSPDEAKGIPNGAPGQYVLLLVSDTGTGIAPEALARIFEPFFTTKDPGKGTGLGLATLARIVSNHAGFATVKSELGAGTTFEVYLPRAAPAAAPASASLAAEPPRGRGEWILLTEDDRSLREMIGSSLVEHGYRVASAANAAECLTLFTQHQHEVRLLLTALTTPLLDLTAMLETIRAHRPNFSIILMSGELKSGAPVKDVTAFLPKPFRLEQLLTVIASELARQPRETT
jgi:CheY-like chemotaxis protein